MPVFVITGKKVMKDGKEHVIRETAPSRIKAEWVSAHFVAEGYEVSINEVEENK